MMKSIASLFLLAVSVTSFTAPQPVATTTSSTALNMGLFDAFGGKPKPKEPEKIGGMDVNVFGGRGKKITIREDEDNAMWIEEDDSGKRKKAK